MQPLPHTGVRMITDKPNAATPIKAGKWYTICVEHLIGNTMETASGIILWDDKEQYRAFEVISSDVYSKWDIVMLNSYSEHKIKTISYYVSKSEEVIWTIL